MTTEPHRARYLPPAVLAAVLLGGGLCAQRGDYRYVQGSDSLFSVPRSQDDIHVWRQARLNIEDGDHATAVERLHELLRHGRPGVVPLAKGRYLGLRTAVLRTLAAMPEAGQQAYEKLVEREAGALRKTAFAGRDHQELETLAWRFPTSRDGRRARLLLGDLALEAGAGHEAMEHYSALLFAMHRLDRAREVVRARMAAAAALVGATPGDKTTAFAATADEVRSLAARKSSTVAWPCYGGGGGGIRPMVPPLSKLSARRQVQLARTYDGMYRFAMHCVGGLSGIYLNNGHEVLALDPITRRRLWRFPGPYVRGADYSINQKSSLSCAVSEDIVVAALQVPDAAQIRRTYRDTIELINAIPTRRLFAMDRSTGKLRWSHWDRQEGTLTKRFHGHDAAGPPLIHGDTIYLATQDRTGAIAYYLGAYDVRTGEPRWRSLICSSQGEVNMFGNVRHEFAAGPLAIQDGVVYGTTNLGVCYAADARTGRVRWATAYDIIPLPRTRLTRQRSRPVVFENNPVVVAQGVMVTTPLDSEFALAFDTATGQLLWKMDHLAKTGVENRVKWLLGVLGDEVIFSGAGVVGVKLRGATAGQPITPRSIRAPNYLSLRDRAMPARGAIAGSWIYFPSTNDIRIFDRNGNAAPNSPIPLAGAGNLLLVDGILTATRNDSVTACCNVDALLHDAERRIQNDPDNPQHYLHLAMLLRSTGSSSLSGARGARAIRMLKRGLAAAAARGLDRESPVLKRLAAELFQISLARGKSLKKHAPDRALAILRRAQSEATTPFQWLQAQEQILELCAGSPKTYVLELDRMALAHGSETYSFRAQQDVGRINVRAYALWQSIQHLRFPKTAAGRCQNLIEEFPSVDLGGETGRAFAVRTLHGLLQKHGRGIYAGIEERARRALAAAAGSAQALRRVEFRFPHSHAADEAMTQRLDIAVTMGNLESVAQIYSQRLSRGEPGAGMLRRLMVVAQQGLNRPLARALGERLLAAHADLRSDFAPDKGLRFGDVVKLPALPPARPAPQVELPADHLGKPIGGIRGESTDILSVAPQPGFVEPEDTPLYTLQDVNTLQAYDLRDPARWDRRLFPANIRHQVNGKLLLCGTTLVVPEFFSVHGLHYRSGKRLWSHDTKGYRELRILGLQQGVLHVYSKHVGRTDGGELLGLEPLTGTVMFRHDIAKLTVSSRPPKGFLGDLWVLADETPKQKPQVLRLDGLTGRIEARTPLPVSLLQRLRLGDGGAASMILDRLQQGMLVDANAIYISQWLPSTGRPPFVVAIRHQGGQRWIWTGDRDGRLERCGLHRAGIIVLEVRGSVASKFCVLATSNGAETRQRTMRGVVEVANWDRYVSADQPPDQVLLAQEARGLTLTCMSLTKDVPSFRYPLPVRNRDLQEMPVFGSDFLAIPVVTKRGDRRELFVIDQKSRRGALPNARKSIELAPARIGFKLTVHGKYIVYQDGSSVHVLGKGVTVK
ncbi:MAG: outer membrane protein assembly factor BamB family protein [Planctomycetota bacterium]